MTSTSSTVLLATVIVAGCGGTSDPDCAAVGRKLGALEVAERYGPAADFMTAHERGEVVLRWTLQCESDHLTGTARRCVANANSVAEASACANRAASAQVAPPTAWQPRWVHTVGGTGSQYLEHVVIARNGDLIAAGYFGESSAKPGSHQATLGSTTLTTAGSLDIWVGRFSPDGAPQWLRRLGADAMDTADALAVKPNGEIVVGPRSRGEVDYGAGTAYLSDGVLASIGGVVVVVTLAADGGAVRAFGLPYRGFAESIGVLPDGDLVVASRSTGVARETGAECDAEAFVLSRVHDDGTLAWLRCNDPTSRATYSLADGHAHVVVGPDGSIAMCASFTGRMSWAGQVGEASGDDDASSAFVVSMDPSGSVRWARYAYGDVSCAQLAVTDDGTVAVRLDNFPSPHRVEVTGAAPANGPAVAAWSADGDLLWLRTCEELLGAPGCAIRSLVSGGAHLSVAARSGQDAVLAQIAARRAKVIDVRAVPRAALGRELVSYGGSFAFGTTSEAGVDLGLGVLPPQHDDQDAVIGVLDPSNPNGH